MTDLYPGAFVCPACEAGRHRECGTFDCHCGYRAPRDSRAPLDACEDRERDLRQALLEGSYFHVTHDGTVRHPTTCNDCRALAERLRGQYDQLALDRSAG